MVGIFCTHGFVSYGDNIIVVIDPLGLDNPRIPEISAFWVRAKEYIERRHGEPFKFLFLPKMGLLGNQRPLYLPYKKSFSISVFLFSGKQNRISSPSL